MQSIFAYIYRKCNKIFTYHEDFPDTIDGEKITQKVKVFSLESFGILYSLLEIQKEGEGENRKICHFHNHLQQNCKRESTVSKHSPIFVHLLIQRFLNS